MRLIPVVDEQDELIGYKEFDEVTPADIYRVAALWITDSQGKVLLAQRAAMKKRDPLKWGPAVAGTVEKGESYAENIVKEIREEIGLIVSLDELTLGPKSRQITDKVNYFAQWYTLLLDQPAEDFVLEKEEVERVKWFDPTALKSELETGIDKFTPSASRWIALFL